VVISILGLVQKAMKKNDETNPVDVLAEEGMNALKSGDIETAINRFKRAIRMAPFRQDIKDLLADALDRRPLKKGAIPQREETEEEEEEEEIEEEIIPPQVVQTPRKGVRIGLWLLLFCALCLTSLGFFFFFSNAIQNFITNLTSSKEDAQISPADRESAALYKEAELLQDQRRYSEAILSIQKAIGKNPTNQKQFETKLAELYYEQAEIFYKRDDYPKAIASYEKAVEHNPDSAEYHYGLGWANYILGRKNQSKRQRAIVYYEKAQVAFQKSLELEPDNIRAKNALAQVYIAQNDAAKAAELYRQIIRQDSTSIEAERARRALQSMGMK
jgi:tetratricopeptide (TPR) repeat protein